MGETQNPFIFMISGFSDVSLSPKTNIIYCWRHQDTPNNRRKSEIILTVFFETFGNVRPTHFENVAPYAVNMFGHVRIAHTYSAVHAVHDPAYFV